MPELLEKVDVLISETSETESILELASKLAIYAAENARKRQRERKDEIGKLNGLMWLITTKYQILSYFLWFLCGDRAEWRSNLKVDSSWMASCEQNMK